MMIVSILLWFHIGALITAGALLWAIGGLYLECYLKAKHMIQYTSTYKFVLIKFLCGPVSWLSERSILFNKEAKFMFNVEYICKEISKTIAEWAGR
jgi:hypothetical protein